MNQSNKPKEAILEMKASAELNKQISEELLQEDPDASVASASIQKFNTSKEEEDNGSTTKSNEGT